jgi:hypothetical protein
MAKKSSPGPLIINDQSNDVRVQSSRSPAPSAPNMSPSRPPGSMSKSNVYAPETPITGNPEQSGDITSNPYNQDLDQLVGGASPQPAAGDVRRPVNDGSAPLQPRPDIA